CNGCMLCFSGSRCFIASNGPKKKRNTTRESIAVESVNERGTHQLDKQKSAPFSDTDDEDESKKEKVKEFMNDVKDGKENDFDPTTTSGVLKQLIIRVKELDISAAGSQLAFFFLLSLFPLLIFLFTLLPYLQLDQSQIFMFIREYAPESTASLIEGTL